MSTNNTINPKHNLLLTLQSKIRDYDEHDKPIKMQKLSKDNLTTFTNNNNDKHYIGNNNNLVTSTTNSPIQHQQKQQKDINNNHILNNNINKSINIDNIINTDLNVDTHDNSGNSYHYKSYNHISTTSVLDDDEDKSNEDRVFIDSKSSPYKEMFPENMTTVCGKRKGIKGSLGGSGARRNERERNRVRQVNLGFDRLRQHVPQGKANKKLSKVDTLKAAVGYIQQLQNLLGLSDEALRLCYDDSNFNDNYNNSTSNNEFVNEDNDLKSIYSSFEVDGVTQDSMEKSRYGGDDCDVNNENCTKINFGTEQSDENFNNITTDDTLSVFQNKGTSPIKSPSKFNNSGILLRFSDNDNKRMINEQKDCINDNKDQNLNIINNASHAMVKVENNFNIIDNEYNDHNRNTKKDHINQNIYDYNINNNNVSNNLHTNYDFFSNEALSLLATVSSTAEKETISTDTKDNIIKNNTTHSNNILDVIDMINSSDSNITIGNGAIQFQNDLRGYDSNVNEFKNNNFVQTSEHNEDIDNQHKNFLNSFPFNNDKFETNYDTFPQKNSPYSQFFQPQPSFLLQQFQTNKELIQQINNPTQQQNMPLQPTFPSLPNISFQTLLSLPNNDLELLESIINENISLTQPPHQPTQMIQSMSEQHHLLHSQLQPNHQPTPQNTQLKQTFDQTNQNQTNNQQNFPSFLTGL